MSSAYRSRSKTPERSPPQPDAGRVRVDRNRKPVTMESALKPEGFGFSVWLE